MSGFYGSPERTNSKAALERAFCCVFAWPQTHRSSPAGLGRGMCERGGHHLDAIFLFNSLNPSRCSFVGVFHVIVLGISCTTTSVELSLLLLCCFWSQQQTAASLTLTAHWTDNKYTSLKGVISSGIQTNICYNRGDKMPTACFWRNQVANIENTCYCRFNFWF